MHSRSWTRGIAVESCIQLHLSPHPVEMRAAESACPNCMHCQPCVPVRSRFFLPVRPTRDCTKKKSCSQQTLTSFKTGPPHLDGFLGPRRPIERRQDAMSRSGPVKGAAQILGDALGGARAEMIVCLSLLVPPALRRWSSWSTGAEQYGAHSPNLSVQFLCPRCRVLISETLDLLGRKHVWQKG